MGIDGLLNMLKPITQKEHISSFKNQCIAIDGMPWIYKGCYGCAFQLNQNVESVDFLYYILEMIDMLGYYNIKPIFVFDGRPLLSKADTLEKRKRQKDENKQRGLQLLKNNQHEEAKKYLSRCIVIDERIINTTINALATKNIEFMFAPFQADSQITKLFLEGVVQAAITEDSDIVAYGVKAILKLNHHGQCDYIDTSKWSPADVSNKFVKAYLFLSLENRVDAAVLAGNDYNPSVRGIGIKRSIRLITRQATLMNAVNNLRKQKVYAEKVPEEYEKTVKESKMIFLLATTWSTKNQQLQYLRPEYLSVAEGAEESYILEIVGKHYPYDEKVRKGQLDSKTMKPRVIELLNFRSVFAVNRENLILHQQLCKRKRQEQNSLRLQELQEQAKDKTDIKPAMSEEEKEKLREDRKKRGIRLQDMMNTVIQLFADSSSESDLTEEEDRSEEIMLHKQPQQPESPNHGRQREQTKRKPGERQTTKSKQHQASLEDSQQEFEELAVLNPFIKKIVGTNVQTLQGMGGSKN